MSDRLNVAVYDNMASNVEDMVFISGRPIMVDDALYVHGSFALSLASFAGNTGVLSGTALPTYYDHAAFDSNAHAQQLTYGSIQTDGSRTGLIAHFRIDTLTGGRASRANGSGKPKKCKKRM